ncbi:MAG TPA: efflux RND transporter permease subunit [Acetobacteraceae bacterium]
MNPSAGFIRRPIATALLAVSLLLLGIVAYPLLPVAPLPQVDFPTIQVSGSLPGASPETMASNVATPLERQFSLIPGLDQMTSVSALGNTQVTLQFNLSRNIDAAATDVQAAINAAGGQLPTNLPSPPTYRKVNPADAPILVMALTSKALPLTQVNDYADNILAQQLSQIDGVGLVQLSGTQKPAVRIQLDPARLASLGLGFEDVRSQVAVATSNAPKGNFDGNSQSFTVYDNDQLTTASPWNDVIVAYRGGSPIRVRDLGTAVDGPENSKLAAWAYTMGNKADGPAPRAIVLAVSKLPGANVIETVDRVKAALPRLQGAIPPTVEVSILTDRTQTIRASVADVQFTLVLTIVLVVMVIFVFLRNVAATVIPSLTVPLALMGAAAVMYVAGFSLDNLSLMALTVAVGFVVDDAIVVLENIYRYIEDGMEPMDAALKGAGEIGFTVIAISVSLIAVFIPLLLMGGIVGRLLREFALTVSITIVLSVLISLTLTPMLCSRFLHHVPEDQHGRMYRIAERGFVWMLDGYAAGLRVALRFKFVTLMVFFATVGLTAFLFITIPKGFFPQQDTGFLFGQAVGPEDSSSGQMAGRMTALGDLIRKDPDVESLAFNVGATSFNQGNYYINLKPKDGGRTATADEIIARLRPKAAQVPGVTLFLQSLQDIRVGGRLSRTQYQYTLTSPEIGDLNTWAPRVLDKMRGIALLTDVTSDQQSNAPAATLTIDRDQASRFGIQPTLIDATLYDAIGQRQVAQYFTQLNSYHVVMEALPELQADPSLLDQIYLQSPVTGGQVPLSLLVKQDTSHTNALNISHQSQFPAVTLSFNLAPGASLGQATQAIEAAEAEMHLPSTLSGAFQGTAQAFQSSLASQPYLIAAALVTVYIVLGVLYESFIHPLTILSTLPSAGVGALLILMAFGYDLSVIAIIGILLLIGIVKKNGIMMVDVALHLERDGGKEPEEAIFEACKLRFRPILMTTMCALLGGVPLMLGTCTGSELRRPLGFAMVGGLILSQILTLFTTPVVYLYLDRVNNWLSGAKRVRVREAVPAE